MHRHLKSRALWMAFAASAVLGCSLCFGGGPEEPKPPTVELARDGRPLQTIVVGQNASPATRLAAEELAQYLGRMNGAAFQVASGDAATGVAVGIPADFPARDHGEALDSTDPTRRDDYLLRSHSDGLDVIGASETGVTLAVWDLLERLGYRLYFLTDTWEIIPERSSLGIAVDTIERPDYVTRQAPRGAPWSDRELWDRWRRRNRVLSSFHLNTGHSYGRIFSAKREQFAEHPEYCALVDGERQLPGEGEGSGNMKFCISNPGLRKLVVDYAVETIRSEPERETVSLDPSDGGGWCECAECAAMGSVSDRVVILAGEAAEAINRLELGPRYVGIYAYSQHSPPPSVEVHPRVIVSIATSFIRGGHTLDELLEGWQARGATLGIRDYYDVFAWSHDRPRRARGGDVAYLCRTIPRFHECGARFMNSENSDSWGANGLGYWLSPRLLWDVDAAGRVDELIDDFLQNAFGPAEPPMRRFYTLLARDDTLRSSEDVVARMYRGLDEARRLADDESIRARLDDLVLYTRYLELYHAYRAARGQQRQRGFERVWQHAYRMRDRMMISTRAICQRDRFRDKSVSVPETATWNAAKDDDPWKSEKPFSREEIAVILADGMAANRPTELEFEPIDYSDDLVPAAPLQLSEVKPTSRTYRTRGRQTAYTWVPKEGRQDGRPIRLEVTGGLIPHYRDRGNVRFALHAIREDGPEPVDRDRSVPPDGEPRPVALSSPHGGLHRIEWSDGKDMTRVAWSDGLPLTFRPTAEEPLRLQGRWSLYFYVPRQARTVGGFATATTGRILDGNGRTVFSFDEMDEPGYFGVAVPAGQHATVWQFDHCTGSRLLMTVPPCLAPSAGDLLLPREVVDADGGRW